MTSAVQAPPKGHGRTSARARRWELAIVVSWLGALAVIRAAVLQENDPYWQVRAGMENLDGLPLARPDTWSWAPVDALFAQTSPMWNDVLALGYRWAGFAGFFVVGLVSVAAYFAVAFGLARRLGAGHLATLVGVLVAVLPALAMLSPRASLAAQTLFMAGLLLADRWRLRPSRPSVVVDAALVAVSALVLAALGSWLHLSWLLLSGATVVAWSVLWLSTPGLSGRRIILSAATFAGALAGVLVGPYGLDAWAVSRRVQEACEGVVLEWAGMFTPVLAMRWAPAGLLAIGGFVLTARWAWCGWARRAEDPRVGLMAALTVVGLPAALASVEAIRFIGVALLLLAPVASLAVSSLAGRAAQRSSDATPTGAFRSARVQRWSHAQPWRVVLTMVAALLVPVALVAGAALGRPLAVEPAADTLPNGCRLFSDPGSAGGLLLLRPDVKVWVDGRADYWGRDRNAEAVRILTDDEADVPPIAGATCVVLQNSSGLDTSALAASLDASEQWRRLDSHRAITWVRAG